MDIAWDELRLFLAVAETGSVSAAARVLRIAQPTVTRRLQQLEHDLGARLFSRSVEGTALTAAGERLVPAARKMAEYAGEVTRVAAARTAKPEGLVRIATTPIVAYQVLAPFAARVMKRHPGVRLEVTSSVGYVDLARGEAELAIRMRADANDDLRVLASIPMEPAAFVSRALKAKLPKKPRLHEVPWIAWATPFEALLPNPLLRAAIPDFKPAFASDNIIVNLAAAEAGLGAIVLGGVQHRLAKNVLVPLDLELPPTGGGLHLVCARSALDISRVRVVADLLIAELAHLQKV